MNDLFILKLLQLIVSRPVHTDHTQSTAHEICLIHWQSLIKVSSTSLLSQLMEGVSKNEGKSLYKKMYSVSVKVVRSSANQFF